MSDRPTPETDRAEYEIRLGKHRRMVVRPSLARDLEHQRDEAKKELRQIESLFFGGFLEDTTKDGLAWRLFNEMMPMRKERNAYAETLRLIAAANGRSHHEAAFATLIRNRHPELTP